MENSYIAHVGKADVQSLEGHLSDVGLLAAQFAAKINLSEAGAVIGLLHDFGKYSKDFQDYINSGTGRIDQDDESWVNAKLLRGKIDHSTAGAQYLWQVLKKIGLKRGQGELTAQILALCVASHHSGLIDCLNKDGKNSFIARMSKSDDKSHCSEASTNADVDLKKRIDNLLAEPLVRQVTAEIRKTMVQLGPKPIPDLRAFALGMLTRFLFSCLIDADRLNSTEFEMPDRKEERLARQTYYKWDIALVRFNKKLEGHAADKPIDQIRRDISDNCYQRAEDPQGIYTLSVPTGGGKTLTSLRYALGHARHYQLDRIIYVIPYTSIIEQNAQVARGFLERDGDPFPWVLEHHSNLDPERQSWKTKLLSENWDAPIVFTTMVQFLEILFGGGTRSVRRMHQLANAVLVFDEIQTLPIKCVHLFCNALNYLTQHANTTAVLCTATQPLLHQLRKPEFGQLKLADNHELVDDKARLSADLSRTTIHNRCKPGGWQRGEIVDLILKRYQQQGSCLVIVNTKHWAKALYKSLTEVEGYNSEALFHLSTNQCVAHRKVIFSAIRLRLAEGLPVLCVSTQLIEAGVDVDFSSVIRFLAGLDSINQAAGRCNRNGLLKDTRGSLIKGCVDVVNPAEKPLNMLVDIYEGARSSERVFREFDQVDLLTPQAMYAYYQDFFFKRSSEMVYPVDGVRNLLSLLGENSNNPGSGLNTRRCQKGKFPLLQQSFMKAGQVFKTIDAPTHAVIVPYGKGDELIKQLCGIDTDYGMARLLEALEQAQQYSVNVFPNEWKSLEEVGAVKKVQEDIEIYFLDSQYYSDAFGVSSEKVAELEFLSC